MPTINVRERAISIRFFHRAIALQATACLALALVGGCSDPAKNGQGKGAPQVGFVVAAPSAVPITTTLSGRVVAYESSEVRPQVSGVIRKRLFAEGSLVRAGQPLFQIDPSLYQAAANEASANVAAAQASAEAASARANRLRPLAEMEAVAKQDYTDALATARQARASVAQNQASLETARINLRFTTVPAPITGRIGRSLFTVGALVSTNQAEPLAQIQRMDPIFVDMQQSSADLIALRRALGNGGALPGSTVVRLELDDGSPYGPAGTVQFSEITVNAATGTVTLRAAFPNPKGELLPGMFVQASFDQAINPNAFLIPQAAMQRDFSGEGFVYLVGPNHKVVRRPVTADRTIGANWVVTKGLKRGDRVITQGTANLKQGEAIRPVPASAPQHPAPQRGEPGSARRGG